MDRSSVKVEIIKALPNYKVGECLYVEMREYLRIKDFVKERRNVQLLKRI